MCVCAHLREHLRERLRACGGRPCPCACRVPVDARALVLEAGKLVQGRWPDQWSFDVAQAFGQLLQALPLPPQQHQQWAGGPGGVGTPFQGPFGNPPQP